MGTASEQHKARSGLTLAEARETLGLCLEDDPRIQGASHKEEDTELLPGEYNSDQEPKASLSSCIPSVVECAWVTAPVVLFFKAGAVGAVLLSLHEATAPGVKGTGKKMKKVKAKKTKKMNMKKHMKMKKMIRMKNTMKMKVTKIKKMKKMRMAFSALRQKPLRLTV
ncbi:hypothetical protein HGM15179_003590 [Zosterops borbonicus]|uniref:Uncharacterized protein n=1 Tax=Zosterops borbonicus TaxID=364589 RepID=A0A8K1LQX8_9PASS|nr:hypothetical protein HGM15179_003590 [Zosterops borbonicus]